MRAEEGHQFILIIFRELDQFSNWQVFEARVLVVRRRADNPEDAVEVIVFLLAFEELVPEYYFCEDTPQGPHIDIETILVLSE